MDDVADWMSRVVSTGSWRTFDDLHVDEYPRDQWVDSAFALFRFAVGRRDRRHPTFAVMLGFTLAKHATGWASAAELLDDSDEFSPPSVYLFDATTDALANALSDASAIVVPPFVRIPCQAFVRLASDGDGSPNGSLLLVSLPTPSPG
jgi:hypothetical protein